jgi:uncharacterized membrane protein YjgN (DUF898 family)
MIFTHTHTVACARTHTHTHTYSPHKKCYRLIVLFIFIHGELCRSSNVVLVMVIGALGLLIGWVIEMSTKYRSLSFSVRFSFDFSHR